MTASNKILFYFGNVYRLRREQADNSILFAMDALYSGKWEVAKEWDDPSELAATLIKVGAVTDHQSAFAIIQG